MRLELIHREKGGIKVVQNTYSWTYPRYVFLLVVTLINKT